MSSDRANRGPWGPLATIGFTLVIAGAFLVVQGVVAIPYLLFTVTERSQAAIAVAAASLQSDGLFVGISEVCSATIAVALTLLAAWLRKGPVIREYLGFRTVPRVVALRWLLYAVLVVVLLEVLAHLTGYAATPDWMLRIYRSAGSLPLLLFAIVVVAPIVEEIVFRGFLFEGLRRSWLGDAGTVLLTSVVFASIHVQYEAFYIGQVFGLGLLLGAGRMCTGSVILTIAMHALVNAVATLQLALEMR